MLTFYNMVSADDIYLFVPLRPMTRVSDLFTQQLNIEVTGDSTALNVGIDCENFSFHGTQPNCVLT